MKKRSFITLVFAVFSVVFYLLLIFFRTPFALYPLMNNQDVLDLLTPLALIPTYWLLFKYTAGETPNLLEEMAFMIITGLWVAGQGMHLSANSVNNLAEALAKKQEFDILSTSIYQLTYFYDEHLSHYLWHIGIVGFAALLVYRDWRRKADVEMPVWWLIILSGVLYGFTIFCIFLEGQTMALGLPFVLVITLLIAIWGRKQLATKPILAFFFVACLVALVLFSGWGIYWKGFPQFSDVGLI